MKYGKVELGQMEAVVNKLGGMDGLHRFLAGELTVSHPTRTWHEHGGVIYFSVTSDGTTGPQWIERLKAKGFRFSSWAESVLRLPDFHPTSGVTTEIAVLKGLLFEDNDRITSKIRANASARKLEKPNAEVVCLIREMFSDEEIEGMGLYWIVAMHEPIKDSDGDPGLLSANRSGYGRVVSAYDVEPFYRWDRFGGFAFAVPQVSA